MLGISATVERKDKLTKILYMFIGDRIYSEERKDEDAVEVRAIQYKTNDPEFNEAEQSKKIAKYLNTQHNEYYINSADVLNIVEKSQIFTVSHFLILHKYQLILCLISQKKMSQ